MQKVSIKLKFSILVLLISLLLFSSIASARIGVGGGVGVGGFGDRPYNNNVDVNRNVYDVNRVNVYNAPGTAGRYYYNGVYYNNCTVVPGHWNNSVWIPESENCW